MANDLDAKMQELFAKLFGDMRAPVAPLPTATLPNGDQQSRAAYEGFDPTDIAKSAGQGLLGAGIQALGLPGDLLNHAQLGAQRAGLADPNAAPWGSESSSALASQFGTNYQPVTALGTMAQSLGRWASMAPLGYMGRDFQGQSLPGGWGFPGGGAHPIISAASPYLWAPSAGSEEP
jgi:hypothetical protein